MASCDPNFNKSDPENSSMGQEGKTASEQLGQAGQSLKETAREEGQHLAQRASEKKEEIKTMAKQRAESMFSSQKSRVAEVIGDAAEAIQRTASQFHDQHRETAATYADKVAGQLNRVSSVVREKDMGYFVHETENFARRQPKLFLGGALAAGFLVARFLKSSSEHQRESESRPGAYYEELPEQFRHEELPSSEYQISQ